MIVMITSSSFIFLKVLGGGMAALVTAQPSKTHIHSHILHLCIVSDSAVRLLEYLLLPSNNGDVNVSLSVT